MYIRSYGLSTRPDEPNTLNRQYNDTDTPPQGPASWPHYNLHATTREVRTYGTLGEHLRQRGSIPSYGRELKDRAVGSRHLHVQAP